MFRVNRGGSIYQMDASFLLCGWKSDGCSAGIKSEAGTRWREGVLRVLRGGTLHRPGT